MTVHTNMQCSSDVKVAPRLLLAVHADDEEVKPNASEAGRGEKPVPSCSRHTTAKANSSSQTVLGLLRKVYKQTLARLSITIKVNKQAHCTIAVLMIDCC